MYKVSRFGVPFQSTLPRRERHVVQSVFTGDPLFQSTLPRRERQHTRLKMSSVFLFQSTLPRRERQGAATSEYKALQFQSTLPRRERLNHMINSGMRLPISIHAPAKGATAFINIFSLAVRLFFISSHQ